MNSIRAAFYGSTRVFPANSRRPCTPLKASSPPFLSGRELTVRRYQRSDSSSTTGTAVPHWFALHWIICGTWLPSPASTAIYVHSPDRLARNYAYQVLLIDEWRRASVEIVFLNRSLGQSPEDDLLLQVQGIVSEYERAKIMERSRRGKKHAAQRGSLNVMSNAPYGYRFITVHDGGGQARFEPIPNRSKWSGTFLNGLDESGAPSLRSVVDFSALVSSPRREKCVWSRQTVWHILQNPVCRGT